MRLHPEYSPDALAIGPIAIKWYALTYIAGFLCFLWLAKRQIRKGTAQLRSIEDLDNLFFYGVLGVILGGRLGFVLFYQPGYYLSHPIEILKIWHGGMSFHGGLIGVIIAMCLFSIRYHYKFADIADFVAPFVPIGLFFGRIGNFINGELWGRITDPSHFWAMGFPTARQADSNIVASLPEVYQAAYLQFGSLPRHPSQLYEMALEGIVLLIIMFIFTRKPRKSGQVAALFLMAYGLFRFIVEFTREPDDYLGLLSLGLTMGQWLSIPMFLIGLIWYLATFKKPI